MTSADDDDEIQVWVPVLEGWSVPDELGSCRPIFGRREATEEEKQEFLRKRRERSRSESHPRP